MKLADMLDVLKNLVKKGAILEYSLVFLGERNKKKILEEIYSKLGLINPAYQVIFLTNKMSKNDNLSNINKHLNFKTIIFDSFATNEEMFETLIQKENLGTVILFKESAININFKEINKMIELNSKNSILVVSKQNKKENLFQKIYHYIKDFFAHLFLGIHLFDSEADIILLDKILISTMTEMPGKSATLTKVNGWIGIEPKYVTIDEQPKEKIRFSIKSLIPVIIISSILLLLILGDILFSIFKTNIPFLVLFLYIIIQVAVLALLIYSLTRVLFKLKFGNISYVHEANIINEIDNFDD